MLPKYHILFGFFLSLILFIFCEKINLLAATIIFLSSFLIDIDHYLFRAWKLKQRNIFKAYFSNLYSKKNYNFLNKAQKKKVKLGFYIFHGFEVLIILFLLGFFLHEVFYFILIGAMFHLIFDYLEMFVLGGKIHKISAIFDYFHYDNKP